MDRNLVLVVDDDPGDAEGGTHPSPPAACLNPSCFICQGFQKPRRLESAVCVILDINLTDGSGIDSGIGLRADGHSVPVIYMTASEPRPIRREAALQSGCIAFLTKPFSVRN